MNKKGNHYILKVTGKELLAMIDMRDDISAMIGNGKHDTWADNVKAFDRMSKRNGFKSRYE